MSTEQEERLAPRLLYPFYLDTEMSMAFAATLLGGVTFEEETAERSGQSSESLRKLEGSLRLWRIGNAGGERGTSEGRDSANESRAIRRQSEASVFIALFDELVRSGQISDDPPLDDIEIGSLVSVKLGPAVAPLRRVLDQLTRLFDVLNPLPELGSTPASATHGKRNSPRQPPAQRDDGNEGFAQLRRLLQALQEDLDHGGLIDMIVTRENAPSVLLTLDRRFVGPTTLEMLHTSVFEVVGKVTRIWSTDGTVVNPYRQSAISLVPSMAQSLAWGVFALIGTLAKTFASPEMQNLANEILQINQDSATDSDDTSPVFADAPRTADPTGGPLAQPSSADSEASDDITLGEDVAALYSMVQAPAFQLLPLAIAA